MNIDDKKEFAELVNAALSATGRNLPNTAGLTLWWEILEKWPLDAIRGGIKFVMTSGEYLTPGSVVKAISSALWEPADVVWSRIPKTEQETVVESSEALSALAAAGPLIDDGDMIAARQAFIKCYDRQVSHAAATGSIPKTRVSVGWDKATIAPAIEQAMAQGRLTAEQAGKYLPAAELARMQLSADRVGLARIGHDEKAS